MTGAAWSLDASPRVDGSARKRKVKLFALLHPFLSSHVVARAGGHLRAAKTIANTWEIRIVSVGALDGESRTRNLDSCAEKLRRFRVGWWTIVSCRDLGATGACGGEFMSFGFVWQTRR